MLQPRAGQKSVQGHRLCPAELTPCGGLEYLVVVMNGILRPQKPRSSAIEQAQRRLHAAQSDLDFAVVRHLRARADLERIKRVRARDCAAGAVLYGINCG